MRSRKKQYSVHPVNTVKGPSRENVRDETEKDTQAVEITLSLLNAVGENSSLTQRSIARDLNIALGLANAYLKRCVRKGLIKVQQVPRNRYAYYLTPQGFAEKSRLTSTYLSISFNFFREARRQCAEVCEYAAKMGWKRVALVGCSDIAEIATLCAREYGIEIAGIVDAPPDGADKHEKQEYAGLPLVVNLSDLGGKVQAVLVTNTENPQQVFDALSKSIPNNRILTIALLNVSREQPKFGE
jgi:DNA-binding MarR family transcriptional regulator